MGGKDLEVQCVLFLLTYSVLNLLIGIQEAHEIESNDPSFYTPLISKLEGVCTSLEPSGILDDLNWGANERLYALKEGRD